MEQLINKMIRAAKLDASLYDEVGRDESALFQAFMVVLLVSVAAGLGGLVGGPMVLIGNAISAVVGWFVWAVLTYVVGTRMMPEPGTHADLGKMLRVTGFSMTPGVILVLTFLPLLGPLVGLAAGVWMFAAMVVGVRQALSYTDTGKAAIVCVIAFVVNFIVLGAIMLVFVGSALFAFGR